MQLPTEAVLKAALGLPEGERIALVSRLLETIPVEDSALALDDDAMARELDRRFADHAESVEWSQPRAES